MECKTETFCANIMSISEIIFQENKNFEKASINEHKQSNCKNFQFLTKVWQKVTYLLVNFSKNDGKKIGFLPLSVKSGSQLPLLIILLTKWDANTYLGSKWDVFK